jgi:hypothetical protein
MDPPVEVAKLATETKFPDPDDPTNPSSSFTLSVEQARRIRALIVALGDYITVEYARCGKQETPTPP